MNYLILYSIGFEGDKGTLSEKECMILAFDEGTEKEAI
jgi:hypothetical protein